MCVPDRSGTFGGGTGLVMHDFRTYISLIDKLSVVPGDAIAQGCWYIRVRIYAGRTQTCEGDKIFEAYLCPKRELSFMHYTNAMEVRVHQTSARRAAQHWTAQVDT